MAPIKGAGCISEAASVMDRYRIFRLAVLMLGLWLPVQAYAMAGVPCGNAASMECCLTCPASECATGDCSDCSVCAAALLRQGWLSSDEHSFVGASIAPRAVAFVQAPRLPPPDVA